MTDYATVFTGTITQQPGGSETISGGGVDVPYPGAAGSHPYTANFDVNSSTRITTSGTTGFPDFIQGFVLKKLYEPEDTTPPQSSLTIGTPAYAPGGPFVTSDTPLTVTATDSESGVQNIWYRYFPVGNTPPAYTPELGTSGSFNLTGADGAYEVDTYATDNAGNDESPHSQVIYLDNTPPTITINQPTATNYTHSQTLTLNYTVDDGAGSGVQTVTALLDGSNQTPAGTVLQSATAVNQSISLLTSGLALGTHTFTLRSVDNVGNVSNQSVSFSIIVTAQSIIDDVNQFVALGMITQDEGTSLISKLESAAKARAAGNCPNATTIYLSFISEVQAQTGKKITALAASIMIGDAQYLIAHCP
jgi:hypothetical protein